MNKFCQTESDELIFCYECEFPAEDYYDFGEQMLEYHFDGTCKVCDETFTTKEKLSDHISDDHTQEESRSILSTDNFKCNHCEQSFSSKDNLMVHKKQHHIEMIDTCWGFISGNCTFGDQKCWFRHSPSNFSDIKCKQCNESFRTKQEFKKHQKQKHPSEVPICKNSENKTCKRGDQLCWFKHEETEEFEHKYNENDKVLERLFDLIEELSNRMNKFEQDKKKENRN